LNIKRPDADRPDLTKELMEIGTRCAALPDHDKRSPEEILSYNEKGFFDELHGD